MYLTELAISDFRCLNQIQFKPSSSINLILGANGAGKTSILEAIFCLSRGRSFRANSLLKLIQDHQPAFVLRTKLESEITHQLALQVSRDGSSANTLAKIDGEVTNSLAELSRLLPSIIIDPSIHKLIEDGPKGRRQYLDWGVFHVEP
ncbi:MAG: AAA family ATPase, partial [Gammaproteobacteria bacterium]|nr:AAA family ATPase [Gammaproteobacteria bacterium]